MAKPTPEAVAYALVHVTADNALTMSSTTWAVLARACDTLAVRQVAGGAPEVAQVGGGPVLPTQIGPHSTGWPVAGGSSSDDENPPENRFETLWHSSDDEPLGPPSKKSRHH